MHRKIRSTATVTWITYMNFGTFLQAYALQQTLFRLGYDNKVIDDALIIRRQHSRRTMLKRYFKRLLLRMLPGNEFYRRTAQVEREFNRFKKNHIVLDSKWRNTEQLKDRYDAYIAGSDQIWLPYGKVNPFFYLGFTDRYKIAYAPSFGMSDCSDEMVDFIRPYLTKFDRISVRETQGARILKDRFGLEAEVVVDPTMLLDAHDWDGLIGERTSPAGEGYALCYMLTYNAGYLDFVRNWCRQHSKLLKLFVTDPRMVGKADVDLYVGPTGFLDQIRNADIVFTDSFHGTIFSLVFGKEFLTFKRFADGETVSQNSRLENLMGRLGLMERLVDAESLSFPDTVLDHTSIRNEMDVMRRDSIRYLKESLEV